MERVLSAIEALLLNQITWGVVGLVLAAIALSGRFSVRVANYLLVIASLAAIFGISRAGFISRLSWIPWALAMNLVASALGLGVYYLSAWLIPVPNTPAQPIKNSESAEKAARLDEIQTRILRALVRHPSTDRKSFLSELAQQTPPIDVETADYNIRELAKRDGPRFIEIRPPDRPGRPERYEATQSGRKYLIDNESSQAEALVRPATSDAVDRELQLRDPVLIIEPTHGKLKDNGDYKFNLTLHNAGTSDVERIEVYEYYYRLVAINPLRFEIASPTIDRPDLEIQALKSKGSTAVVVDMKPYVLARPAHLPRPNQQVQMLPIGRIELRYRRSSDGALFCQAKFFLFWDDGSNHELWFESAREMAGISAPIPTLGEIAQALSGTDQRRDCH